MLNFFHEFLIIIFLLFIWLIFGITLTSRNDSISFSKSLIFGFLLYYALFQIYYFPMLFSFVPLRIVSYIWLTFICISSIFCIWLKREIWRKFFYYVQIALKSIPFSGWLAAATVIAFILTSLYFEVTDLDDIYYTGEIATAVYTDSMFCYEPHTGALLTSLNARYALSGYVMQSAVLCVIFSIHPLLLTRFVLPAALIIIVFLIYYRIGLYLFKGIQNNAFLFIIIVAALYIYGSYNIYVPPRFLIFRTEQGKALVANITVPLLLLLFIKLAYHNNQQKLSDNTGIKLANQWHRKYWMRVLICVTASVSFSLSAAFLIPASLCAYYLPYAVVAKKPRVLIGLSVCLIPPILMFLLYKYGGNLFSIPVDIGRLANAV